MKKVLLFLLSTAIVHDSYAQFSSYDPQENSSYGSTGKFTLSSDNNILQIGGRVSGYYEYRTLKSGQTNLKHNNFALKDVDLDFLGKTTGKFVYEIQLSLLDIISAAAVGNTTSSNAIQSASNVGPNPQNPGFKAVYLAYEGKKLPFHVKLGYDKLPYSQGSLNDVYGTPFWSHANLFGGDLFSRRDLGVTLYQNFWKGKLNAYAGVYSGLGENIFEYGGDGSGNPEYVGRVDVSYPSKFKYDVVDEEGSPIPVFRVGVNARYMNKTQPVGRSVYTDAPDAPGAYGIRIIDGKRLAYGGDFIIKYRGLSATFEAHIIDLKPTSPTNPLYEGTPASFNGNKVKAGGFETGINYNFQSIKSVFSINYENINANDLIKGTQEWIYLGYAYKVSGFNSVFKIEYYIPQTEDLGSNPLKYTGQIRIGYQQVF
jgi:hypothetical protein